MARTFRLGPLRHRRSLNGLRVLTHPEAKSFCGTDHLALRLDGALAVLIEIMTPPPNVGSLQAGQVGGNATRRRKARH